ncbi:MAG TPA: nuclear transport factor 2 family protein [Vicinamibacterales bacterium]|nr:nuclear transport factor 2 family protein [Vicinamibacterales bacterium]
MMARRVAVASAILVVSAVATWLALRPAEEGADVRARLQAFCDEVNGSAGDGREPAARAARLGSFFADDVDVDFGRGATPIKGRQTIVGMAERLQPRTAAFRLKFEDMTVAMAPAGDAADVHLTAEFIRRSITTGEESLDAREFTIGMRRIDDNWAIARVTAIETLK